MVLPFVAEMVIVSPAEPPDADIVGVLSEVKLSVDDEPRSEAAARSTAVGADGAVVSIVIDNGALLGDTFPAASVRVEDTFHCPGVNVGRSHDVAGDV